MYLPIIRIYNLSHPLPQLMLPRLIPHIILDISLPNTRPQNPIQDPPRPVVPLTRVNQMSLLAARNAAQEEARGHEGVPGVGEGLFDRDGRDVEEVGEHVEAEDDSWEVGRDHLVHKVDERVVVVCG